MSALRRHGLARSPAARNRHHPGLIPTQAGRRMIRVGRGPDHTATAAVASLPGNAQPYHLETAMTTPSQPTFVASSTPAGVVAASMTCHLSFPNGVRIGELDDKIKIGRASCRERV